MIGGSYAMGEVIVVTSGKGGVGKTTTTANVGTGLAAAGRKVVLIDTDIGLRNLDVVMGLENRIVYNLVDVVEGSCRGKTVHRPRSQISAQSTAPLPLHWKTGSGARHLFR